MNNLAAQAGNISAMTDKLMDFCTGAGIKLIMALLIYIIGRFIIGKLLRLLEKMKSFVSMDVTAKSYILTAVKAVLYVILAVAIIAELGVPMASVIAVIASAGVAVGMALQGSLANLAGGIMLLIFRPFNVGDFIITSGEMGVVKNISLFYTILTTVDNKTVSIPNGAMMNATIENASSEPLRRVDLSFNVAGSEPVKKVQATIMKVVVATDKAMADPAPDVQPLNPVSGGLEYTVRVWCKNEDYWDVYFELMREIPTALGAAGISGPASSVKVTKMN